MHIGKRISYYRKRDQLSLQELSKGIISATHLSNIELGRFQPSEETLLLLAERLHLPSDYVLRHYQRDAKWDEQFAQWKHHLFFDIDALEKSYASLPDPLYIPHIEQEIIYVLLKMSYCMKKNLPYEDAWEQVQHYISSEDELPLSLVHEIYVYALGLHSFHRQQWDKSIYYFEQFLGYKQSSPVIASIHFNYALLYRASHKPFKAKRAANEAMHKYLFEHQWKKLAETYNLLGALAIETEEWDESLSYLSKAQELATQQELPLLLARVHHNIGLVQKSQEAHDLAMASFQKSIQLRNEHELGGQLLSYRSLLDACVSLKDLNRFQQFMQEAASFVLSDDDRMQLQYFCAKWKHDCEQAEDSIEEYETVLHHLLRQNKWSLAEGMAATIAEYYFEKRRYKKAAEYFAQELKIRDAIQKGG
ncbi:helix-turn-helix transcriptional regulator [Bacillus fonticola]|uniref:helix-turn-helix transcriptional regulator n=1 Tax=Bacillus fonticola TaxID=2728853 RepID=UPI0014742DA3|nr:helix-turn-helix transcriptional regulator [Bacillus fonticola]